MELIIYDKIMNNASFFEKETDFTENLVVSFLNRMGISARRNNLIRETDVDIVTDKGIKIDAQYSENFAKWGDLRVDIISAFSPKNTVADEKYRFNDSLDTIRNFELKHNCQVIKAGKIIPEGYLDFLAILFYNDKFAKKDPDWIMFISRSDLISYIKPLRAELFEKIKVNNKSGLGDRHGSAFIPVKVKELAQKTKCVFASPEEITKESLQQYINQQGVFPQE